MRLHPQITLSLKSAVALIVASVLSSCLGSGFKGPDRSEQGVSRMTWAGLAENRVKLSTARDKISMTWEAPRNARGNYYFEIYEGQAKDNRLKVTSDLSWDYPIDPTSSRCYHLSARAFDKDGGDTNASTVVVCNDYDGVPPEMMLPYYAFRAAHNAIYIWWPPSPSLDLAKYNVYESKDIFDTQGVPKDNPTPIASTVQNFIFIDKINGFDLLPNTQYKFVVEAVDGEGNESRARTIVSATTDFLPRPYFRGLIDVRRVAGVDGLTTLELIWLPTTDNTVTGYRIYQSALENYDLPFSVGFVGPIVPVGGSSSGTMGPYVPRLTGGSPTLSTRIDGLSPDTQYCYVARAAVDGNPVNEELNRRVICQKTNRVQAPTFSGVLTAAPGSGDAGFTSGVISWLPAETDGVHNKYLVTYKGFNTDPGNCASASMTGATQVETDFESDVSWTIVGLTPQTYYCVQVNTLYSVPGTYITDSNTARAKFFTSPPNPVHSGVLAVTTSAGSGGFTSLDISWAQASGSFTRYTVEVSSSPSFAAPEHVSNYSLIGTTSTTVTGLTPKTNYYVRVTAYYIYAGPPLVTLPSTPSTKVMSGRTEPPAPNGDGILAATVSSPTSLGVTAVLPTNPGALWDKNFLWVACGPDAVSKIQNIGAAVPYNPAQPAIESYATPVLRDTLPAMQNSYSLSGLTNDVLCCVQWRSHYGPEAGNELVSKSTRGYDCKTPRLEPPPCSGVASVVNSNLNTGFTQLKVNWAALPSNANFTTWRVAWGLSEAAIDFAGGNSAVVPGYATNNYTISGLTPHKRYYVKVRGEHQPATPTPATCGEAAVRDAITTPATPAAASVWTGEPTGATSARFTLKTPPDPDLGGGLHNGGIVYWAASEAALNTLINTRGTPNTAGKRVPDAIGGDFDFSMAGLSVGLGNRGEGMFWISRTANSLADGPVGSNTLTVTGLIPGQQYVFRYRPVYWVTGNLEQYVEGPLSLPVSFTPVAQPPSFGGVQALVKYHDFRDFTKIKAQWTMPTGDCDYIQVSVSTGAPQWDPAYHTTASCNVTEVELEALTPHLTYEVRARAVKVEGGLPFSSGGDVLLSTITAPSIPSGEEAVSLVTINLLPGALDSAKVDRTNSASGDWTHLMVFRASAPGDSNPITDNDNKTTAINAVKAMTATAGGMQGPVGTPIASVPKATAEAASFYTDTGLAADTWYCYAVLAVHDSRSQGDNRFYLPSSKAGSPFVQCGKPLYVKPPDTVLTGANVVQGGCGGGIPKIQLTLSTPLQTNHSIESFDIFVAPGTSLTDFGDMTKGAWANITSSLVGQIGWTGSTLEICSDNVIANVRGFIARWKYVGSPTNDTNTSIATLASPGVTSSGAHWVWVTKSRSGLPYDYLMMNYEAVLTSGSLGSPTVPESAMDTCNSSFHSTGSLASCTTGPAVTVKAVKNSAPEQANWHQAWWACRQSSSGVFRSRLPTAEEWRRAARWYGNSYGTLVSGGTPIYQTQCNTTSDALGTNGDSSNCKNGIGIHDLAGRRREWVDARVRHQAGSTRFGFTPKLARMIDNGIDRLTLQFHLLQPGSGGPTLGLLMGSDYVASGGAYEKQYDAETQLWEDATVSSATTGFRCMAFLKTHLPSDIVDRMALPTEPTYASSDYAGAETTWTIPENRFVGDTKPETVDINVTAQNPPAGTVTISWPYWKIYSGGSQTTLSSASNYEIYRLIEPTRMDQRFATGWALADGPYAGGAVALDPLAVDSSGNRIHTPAGGSITCTGGTCTWVDTLSGTDAKRLFNYILVAKKSHSSDTVEMAGTVQRFRSPYYAGASATSSKAKSTFRLEHRWRRASVGAVSEGYQLSLGTPQVMAHVPMDASGLDHDFYVQAYEASIKSGAFVDNSLSSDPVVFLPVNNLPDPGTGVAWSRNPAGCYDRTDRGVSTVNTEPLCGNLNTNAVLQSKSGVLPFGSGPSSTPTGASYASLFAACRLSTLTDETYSYPMRMITASEFHQAANWGDVNHDGDVDQNPYVTTGESVHLLERGDVTGGCRDDRPSPGLPTTTGTRAACVSRHGVADIVGNAFEQNAERLYDGIGLDNGLDGLWLNAGLHLSPTNALSHTHLQYFLLNGPFDNFRGIDAAEGAVLNDGLILNFKNAIIRLDANGGAASTGHYDSVFMGCGRAESSLPFGGDVHTGACGRFSRFGNNRTRPPMVFYTHDSGGRCAR